VSRPRVARRHRKFRFTRDSNHHDPIAPNILNQNFEVHRRNQVWVSDKTYIETGADWSYLTVIIDLFNRKVVGWTMSDNLTIEETLKWVHIALGNAKRNVVGTYHKIKKKYLHLYLNEFAYTLNRRYFRERIFDRLIIASITANGH
jgi:hypothetical protein